MSNENEGSEQEKAKPTITIAEKDGSEPANAEKETITIAEKEAPRKP